MSEIPFVNLLGDAIDEAIAPRPVARRARRWLQVSLAALLLAGGTAAVAQVVSNPDELVTTNIACFEGAYPDGGVAVASAGSRSPTEFCSGALGVAPDRLIACADEAYVTVLRRSHWPSCARAGLEPLPAGYDASRRRIGRLERSLLELQTSADCIPPEEFAHRTEAVFERLGWTGWKTVLRTDVQQGPCGAVLTMGGTPELTLSGVLDYPSREIMVTGGLPLSLSRLLYGTTSKPGVATSVVDLSGRRCYTEAGVRALAERELRPTGRGVDIRPAEPLPANTGISGPRGARYREGCAVLDGIEPADDYKGLVVRVLKRD